MRHRPQLQSNNNQKLSAISLTSFNGLLFLWNINNLIDGVISIDINCFTQFVASPTNIISSYCVHVHVALRYTLVILMFHSNSEHHFTCRSICLIYGWACCSIKANIFINVPNCHVGTCTCACICIAKHISGVVLFLWHYRSLSAYVISLTPSSVVQRLLPPGCFLYSNSKMGLASFFFKLFIALTVFVLVSQS